MENRQKSREGSSPARGGSRATGERRWSAADGVVLLLLLCALVSLVVRVVLAYIQRGDKVTPDLYDVTFEVTAVQRDILDNIEPFDAVYLYQDDTMLGYVGVYLDEEGNQQVALIVEDNPDSTGSVVSATGCIICTGGVQMDDGGLAVRNGLYLAPGSVVDIRTDRALLTVRITSVSPHQ